MTSQKSFKNNFGFAFRTGIKDNIVVGIVGALFLSFFFCYFPIYKFMNMSKKENITFYLADQMQFFRYVVILGMLGLGIFMGIMAFKFITGKKTVNVFYSLGIKRTSLFTAKFLSGVTVLAIAVIVPLLVSFVANAAVLGISKYLVISTLYLFVGLFTLAFVSFSITSLIFSMVGTAFEGIVFSGLVVLLPQIVLTCLEGLIQQLVFGTPYGQRFSAYDNYAGDYSMSLIQKFPNINPIRFFAQGLFTYTNGGKDGALIDYNNVENTLKWANPDFLPLILWLAFAVAVFCIAVFVYKNRKAEIGGFIGKNKPLNFIATFIVGFFAFAGLVSNLNYSTIVSMLIGLGVFVVIYIVSMLVILRDKHQFVKTLYFLPIQLGITLLIFVFFSTNYFGTANKIPEISNISYAQVSTVNSNYTANDNNKYSYFGASVYNSTSSSYASGKYESQNDLKFITELNKMIVDQGKKTPTAYENDFNGIYPVSIQIKYVLKDGKEIYRNYYGFNQDIVNKLYEVDNTEYNKNRLKDIFYGEYNPDLKIKDKMTTQEMIDYSYNNFKMTLRDSSSTIAMSNKLFGNETALELTDEQRQTLLDCLYNDISSQTAVNRYSPSNTLGAIMFISNRVVEREDTDTESSNEYNYADKESSMASSQDSISSYEDYWFNPSRPVYIISEDMTNTVNFLKSIGYFNYFGTTDDTIKSVKIIKVGDVFSSGYLKSYYNDRMIKRKDNISNDFIGVSHFTSEYGYNDYVNSAYSVSDKEIINKLIENGKLRGQVNKDDYILIINREYSYSTLLVDSANVPDSVKSSAGNIKLPQVY